MVHAQKKRKKKQQQQKKQTRKSSIKKKENEKEQKKVRTKKKKKKEEKKVKTRKISLEISPTVPTSLFLSPFVATPFARIQLTVFMPSSVIAASVRSRATYNIQTKKSKWN